MRDKFQFYKEKLNNKKFMIKSLFSVKFIINDEILVAGKRIFLLNLTFVVTIFLSEYFSILNLTFNICTFCLHKRIPHHTMRAAISRDKFQFFKEKLNNKNFMIKSLFCRVRNFSCR